MPARIRASTYSRERVSTTTDSIPSCGEQVGQQQPGRAGADDRDLSAHAPYSTRPVTRSVTLIRPASIPASGSAVPGRIRGTPW